MVESKKELNVGREKKKEFCGKGNLEKLRRKKNLENELYVCE